MPTHLLLGPGNRKHVMFLPQKFFEATYHMGLAHLLRVWPREAKWSEQVFLVKSFRECRSQASVVIKEEKRLKSTVLLLQDFSFSFSFIFIF